MPSRKDINDRRAGQIAEALSTPEGRIALSQTMTEPIKRALEYQNIGRRLLMVDELPQGDFSDIVGIGYSWSSELHVSSCLDSYFEEAALNDFLIMMEQVKIERIKESTPHYSIMWLEVE